MTTLTNLKVYATQAHPCSYLEQEQASTIFIDPGAELNRYSYSRLAELGFRRSGPHVYKPNCSQCQACIPVRIPVEHFKPSRRHRRVWNKNQDLRIDVVSDINEDKFYDLYERYICQRHADGDMYPPSREQFTSFLTSEWNITQHYCLYQQDTLIAVAVSDIMDNGFSAIYTFFDPDMDKRSLGIFTVLWQIEQAKQLGLPYVYLGYWIQKCRKMNYKADYRPLEMYINHDWVLLR
jgi:arginine-tRNA-protein transferase